MAAAETRREILDAARRLFAEHGYASTSVQQIAAESGVAVQTIYSSVGSKAALVLALNDLIDDEADVAELTARLLKETRRAPDDRQGGASHPPAEPCAAGISSRCASVSPPVRAAAELTGAESLAQHPASARWPGSVPGLARVPGPGRR